MKLTFLGATQTVTGSKYLIETANHKILIDCGLFQGYKELRLRNWAKLPINPSEIDAVILTHAHIDHSGYLPLLIKNGFRGKIYSTSPTYELCSLLLPDSGYLHEEDARRANKYGYSKHHPALPLYTEEDGKKALGYFATEDFGTEIELDDGLKFKFKRAGHILGAACVKIEQNGKSIFFTGDLGRLNDPIMKEPESLEAADYIVTESTYGNREHGDEDPIDEMSEVINSTLSKGGTVLIPSFAVGRAQNILYYINRLKRTNRISSDIPVYLDSPMAIDATDIFNKYHNEHRLSKQETREICGSAIFTRTADESKEIDNSTMPSIIISASGMATGGRVLHHLKRIAPDMKNAILFAGYQAGGTRGDRMVKGEKLIKIHGKMIPINARVENLDNMSAHADYDEIMSYFSNIKEKPKKVFVTHGEYEAANFLKKRLSKTYGWDCTAPDYLDSVEL